MQPPREAADRGRGTRWQRRALQGHASSLPDGRVRPSAERVVEALLHRVCAWRRSAAGPHSAVRGPGGQGLERVEGSATGREQMVYVEDAWKEIPHHY